MLLGYRLAAVGLMPVEDAWMAMKTRADLFFREVNRVLEANDKGHRAKETSLIVLDRLSVLQGSVNFYDVSERSERTLQLLQLQDVTYPCRQYLFYFRRSILYDCSHDTVLHYININIIL